MSGPRPELHLNDHDLVPTPSPAYKQYPSTSNLRVGDTLELEAPGYEMDPAPPTKSLEKARNIPEKDLDRPDEKDVEDDVNVQVARVHYPQDLPVLPSPTYIPRKTATKSDGDSRPGSSVNTDDEDDDGRDEDDEYDWSGEDDLVDEEAKFDKKLHSGSGPKRWGFRRVVTFFLSTLIGSTILAGLIVTAPILLKFLWLNKNPNPHRTEIYDQVAAWTIWVASNLLISWSLAFIINLIPPLLKLLIRLIWGDLSEAVKTRLELYDAAKGTLKPMFYGASGWLSWVIIFHGVYGLYDVHDESQSKLQYLNRVYQAVAFLFFFCLVFSIEKMLMHLITFAFHKRAFQDRLDTLNEQLKVLDHLRAYRPKTHKRRHGDGGASSGGFRLTTFINTPRSERESMFGGSRAGTPEPEELLSPSDVERGEGVKRSTGFWPHRKTPRVNTGVSQAGSGGISSPEGHAPIKGPQQAHGGSSASPLHRYPPTPTSTHSDAEVGLTISGAAKVLKSTVLHDARNLKGKEEGIGGGRDGLNINSAHDAKKLARNVYMALHSDRRRKFLVASDFHPAYPTHEDAEAAFKIFDKDGNGDISRGEIKTFVLKVYKERRFLSRSLRDVGSALKTLDKILLVLALIVLFFISLSLFRVSLGASLTSVYSLGLGLSFIFKNSASSAFDAVIFLLVTHPYDTGDRCFIDDENLVVKKTSLFATTFTRSDGTTTYYFNSQLFAKFITNIRRSGNQFEALTLQVSWKTPLEKLDRLEELLNEWLQIEENRWFEPSTSCILQTIDFQKSLTVTFGIGHNGTWQDWGLKNQRKTAFHAAVRFYCRQLGISCHNSPIPITFTNDLGPKAMNSAMGSPTEMVDPDSNLTDALRAMTGPDVKPMLGFLPPAAERNQITSLRARKSRANKTLRGHGGLD